MTFYLTFEFIFALPQCLSKVWFNLALDLCTKIRRNYPEKKSLAIVFQSIAEMVKTIKNGLLSLSAH